MTTVLQTHLGETAALLTALCWTLNAIVFEAAGKKVGSMAVSYLRIFVAFALLCLSAYFARGLFLPTDATVHSWIWLMLSGALGFVLGDMFLFEAFVLIGSRISLLIMSAAPPLTALVGFLLMGEQMSLLNLAGMFVTMLGIAIVIMSKNPQEKKIKFNRPVKGIIFASLGAFGQAMGLIFSKYGMGSYNVLAATQIRLVAAFIAYTIIISIRSQWPEIRAAFKHKLAIGNITLGAILGPFIGVSLSLLALKHTASGIVSSISSVSPVLIIPLSISIFKEKIFPKEILGAFVSIAGVILLFV